MGETSVCKVEQLERQRAELVAQADKISQQSRRGLTWIDDAAKATFDRVVSEVIRIECYELPAAIRAERKRTRKAVELGPLYDRLAETLADAAELAAIVAARGSWATERELATFDRLYDDVVTLWREQIPAATPGL